MSKKRPMKNKSQQERFIEVAKELECDEDEKAFEDKLKLIVTPKKRRIERLT